jgi:hypothetical protein
LDDYEGNDIAAFEISAFQRFDDVLVYSHRAIVVGPTPRLVVVCKGRRSGEVKCEIAPVSKQILPSRQLDSDSQSY